MLLGYFLIALGFAGITIANLIFYKMLQATNKNKPEDERRGMLFQTPGKMFGVIDDYKSENKGTRLPEMMFLIFFVSVGFFFWGVLSLRPAGA